MRDRAAAILALALTLAACSRAESPTPDAAASSTDRRITGAFEANGRELFIDCIGQGSPTFVLEAGEGVPSDAMSGLKQQLAERGTACSYDRANTGQSGSAPTPRSAAEIVADLNALLSAASVPGPYVLVGHSAGGMFVQMYARTFPENVAGVIAMNPVPPFAEWKRQGFPEMTKQERTGEIAYYEGENGESFDYRVSSEQIDEAPAPPDVPFEMLISTIAQCESPNDICERTYPPYEAIMEAVSQEWPDGGFSQVESGHEIYVSDVEAVLAVVDDVLARIQSG
ncbi:MAG: alpha/beta hydrolase [Actinomycetota bacterium]|nr:alpha/beta hydrolase [Actinomycetota bacterium]